MLNALERNRFRYVERHFLRTQTAATNVGSGAARAWLALLVGACGILAGLALPFAPVTAERVTLTWPAPGEAVTETTALVAPYRPTSLTAVIPCSALRASSSEVLVLATGPPGDGLDVSTGPGGAEMRSDGRAHPLPAGASPDCRTVIRAGPDGIAITGGDGATVRESGRVPQVFGFRTDLEPAIAAEINVTVEIASPFGTSPTLVKSALIAVQLGAAFGALFLLGALRWRPRRPRPSRLWWIDGGVIALLAGWAVIGPLAVDDGWATMIARNFAETGEAGNYYRWWNASEVPFALCEQLLSRFTEVSLAPLWLRLPSTLLGVATWFVVSRGVLRAAVPAVAGTARIRVLAAIFLLAAWLPFNLGTRPESYVALGVTTVLALAWHARSPAGLGWMAVAAALTVPTSPTAVILVAPLAVFGPRMMRVVRRTSSGRRERSAILVLLGCVAAVSITVIFADQTWAGLLTATDWHAYFGPTLPWYHEPDRYWYLLSGDQQGSAFKRMPVLLAVAMLPVAAVLARRRRTLAEKSALRLAGVVVLALLALAFVPSKWSYHLGAVAGLVASFLTVSVVVVARARAHGGRDVLVTAAVGGAVLSGAAALAFAGPNAWWQSTVYDVAWATGPIRPAGLPLDNPLLWIGVTAAICAVLWWSTRRRAVVVAAPAVVTVLAAGTALSLLLGSFAAAPLRRPEGSLAMANLQRITGARVCGLADDVEVLPDGPVLTAADNSGTASGFAAFSGYPAAAPPPEPPGSGASTALWGSFVAGPQSTGTITTPWFTLPRLAANEGVASSVSGRTDDGNALQLEFGRSSGAVVEALGERTPVDRPAIDEDPEHPLWRSIGVDAASIPAGADRVRITAVDGRMDESGWLAFTGPRLRSIVGLTEFLADRGPVLVGWPQAFLFPCIVDRAAVTTGVAETPGAVIESPRVLLDDDRDESIGGTFAGAVAFGELQEIPSRLKGHPDIDWGTLLVAPDTQVPDAYVRTVRREVRWGFDDAGRMRPER